MIANATEALAALKDVNHGCKVLPAKKIARNTHLIYYADELIGLKLHNTVIATYTPEGVTIDVRGFGGPRGAQGWFTMTTWRRINEWTNANTRLKDGLRYVAMDPRAGGPPALYAHGMKIGHTGMVVDSPLPPDVERSVRNRISELPLQLGTYAREAVRAWENYETVPSCCGESDAPDPEHLWNHHMKNGDLVVPNVLSDMLTINPTARPSIRRWTLLKDLSEWMANCIAPLAVRDVARSLPYPQLSLPQLTRKVTAHAHEDC